MHTAASRATDAGGRGGESTGSGSVFPRLLRAADLEQQPIPEDKASLFDPLLLCGRLVELSSGQQQAGLSLCSSFLFAAQKQGLSALWISCTPDSFFPPDLAANGIDLSLLPVLWAPDIRTAVQAADWLMNTAAFGLLILDLHRSISLAAPHQVRLARSASNQGCTVLFLTNKGESLPSLGSMISLYLRAYRRQTASGRYRLEVRVLKDKRTAPCWEHVECVDGPPGLY